MLLSLPKKFLINSWQFLSLFASGVICLIMTFRDDHISTFAIQCNVKNIDLYLPWLLAVEAGYSSLYIILLIKDPFKKKKQINILSLWPHPVWKKILSPWFQDFGLLHYRLRLLKFFANYNTAMPSNSPPSLLWQAAPTQTRLAYQILGRGEVLFVGNHCVVVKRFGNQDNNTNMLCFPWQRENTVTKTRYVLTFLCVSHSINTTQLFANRRSILLRSSESRNFLVQ